MNSGIQTCFNHCSIQETWTMVHNVSEHDSLLVEDDSVNGYLNFHNYSRYLSAVGEVCQWWWHVDSRRSSHSRRMLPNRPSRRKHLTRRQQPRRHSSTHVLSANLRCLTPRPTNNILRVNTQSNPYLRSWRVFSDNSLVMHVCTFVLHALDLWFLFSCQL